MNEKSYFNMFLKSNFLKNLFLVVISGLLLSLGWSGLPVGWIMFVAFIPYLFIIKNLLESDKKRKKLKFFGYSYLTFFIWNLISTWWVSLSTLVGGIAAVVCYSLFMSLTMLLTFVIFKNLGKRYGYVAFVVNWLAYEYIFMNSDVAFPWLILGNSFANNISLIQFYEFIGHLGGSCWILIINVLIFEIIHYVIGNVVTKQSSYFRYSG